MQGLGLEDLEKIYLDHDADETDFGAAFAERFGSPLPDVANADQQFTIIASELDPTSDRIVSSSQSPTAYPSTLSSSATSATTIRISTTERIGGQLLPSHGRMNRVSSTRGELHSGASGPGMLAYGSVDPSTRVALEAFLVAAACPGLENHLTEAKEVRGDLNVGAAAGPHRGGFGVRRGAPGLCVTPAVSVATVGMGVRPRWNR